MDGVIACALFFAVFFALLLSIFWPEWTEYECDLCGRQVRSKEWSTGKAAARHVCDQCREIEAEAERMYRIRDAQRKGR